jgi:hypothetical protein
VTCRVKMFLDVVSTPGLTELLPGAKIRRNEETLRLWREMNMEEKDAVKRHLLGTETAVRGRSNEQ